MARRATTRPEATLSELTGRYPELQLATLADAVPQGEAWIHEIKLDGYRLAGFLAAGTAFLRTRNGNDWTKRFPAIAAAIEKLKADSVVLDMEAVVFDPTGKSSFQALQSALGDVGNSLSIVAVVFDLLYLNGEDLTQRPLLERKKILQQILKTAENASTLRYSEHMVGAGEALFAEACKMGLEGIISKRATGSYRPGRQQGWLKIKCSLRQEFIILGYSKARSGGRALGALYLGYWKGEKLLYAGKVGTGFSMQSAAELAAQFAPLATTQPGLTRAEAPGLPRLEWESIHWIQPVLLCEVSFAEWTADGRVRHPSFEGLRQDKKAREVKKEMPMPTGSIDSEKRIVEGIVITHANRVISETGQVTKGELADYYAAVMPFMGPHIVGRPISLMRCPSGIDGECFYQRNPGKGLGPDVFPYEFKHKGKTYEYLYIKDAKGLIEIVQMGGIEVHPWGSTVDNIDCPDRLIFDLDPSPEVPFEAVKLAAQDLRLHLQHLGMKARLKCTGGKGLHVTVPLAGKDEWSAVKEFAASVAHGLVKDAPDVYVATMTKAKRTNKIFIDFFRNDYTATAIADYSVRARPGAPVAVPLDWKELNDLTAPDQFTIADVLKRMKRKKPPTAEAGYRIPLL